MKTFWVPPLICKDFWLAIPANPPRRVRLKADAKRLKRIVPGCLHSPAKTTRYSSPLCDAIPQIAVIPCVSWASPQRKGPKRTTHCPDELLDSSGGEYGQEGFYGGILLQLCKFAAIFNPDLLAQYWPKLKALSSKLPAALRASTRHTSSTTAIC